MAIAAVTCAGSFTSCSDNDDSGNGNKIYTEPRYMIVASSDEATYLVATDNLEDGSGTIEGIGKEVESATAWVFNRSKYAYRLVYNQGNPGVGSSYTINQEGKVAERSIGFTVTNRFYNLR
mgnify:FL=1